MRFAFFLSMAITLSHTASANEIERKVYLEEGRRLVKMALLAENIADVYDDPSDEQLHDPIITFPIINVGSNGKRTDFGVNAWTGDVWDTFECKIITSPQLVAEQAKIKKRFQEWSGRNITVCIRSSPIADMIWSPADRRRISGIRI